jgi:hypothetical protein
VSGIPVELVITGGVVQLQKCGLYAHAVPILNSHHVCPESWWLAAGKPVASPLFSLCPDCHEAVHVAIDAQIRGLGTSLLPPRCVKLAAEAFPIAEANGLTPALTL